MNNMSRFQSFDGKLDVDEIETWAESYFFTVFNMVNGFLCQVDVNEAVSRLAVIPFDKLTREKLEDESEAVIQIAVAKVNELARMEIEYIKAYSE